MTVWHYGVEAYEKGSKPTTQSQDGLNWVCKAGRSRCRHFSCHSFIQIWVDVFLHSLIKSDLVLILIF